VLDGQSGARLTGPCMFQPCHHVPFRGRQDEDPEDDDQGLARRNINTRGRPIDDLPRDARARRRVGAALVARFALVLAAGASAAPAAAAP
jgi:hypothetical protein